MYYHALLKGRQPNVINMRTTKGYLTTILTSHLLLFPESIPAFVSLLYLLKYVGNVNNAGLAGNSF
jgi:hypothetical protein